MTIRHIVFFSLRPEILRDDPRVVAAAELSRDHGDHIEEIREWRAEFDVSERDDAADFVVMGVFDDAAAIARYLEHPHHRLGVAAWREIADWMMADIPESAHVERRRSLVHGL